MLERILQMVIKEFIQILRDPRISLVVVLTPIIQMLVFGYAVDIDVRQVQTAVYDLDHSAASRALLDSIFRSTYFVRTDTLSSERELQDQLDRGKSMAVIQINRGFQDDINAGRGAEVVALIDGTQANAAGIIEAYLSGIVAQFSHDLTVTRHNSVAAGTPLAGGVVLKSRAWFNDNLESRNFFVPAVVAVVVTLATLMLTSMSIVREKEIGTIEQLIVTPITRVEFVVGKTLPYIIIGLLDVLAILLVSAFWFEVPVRGSLLLLFFAVSLYLMSSLGLGLFISTISKTQQEAMMGAFMFYFPLVLLSGFIFPVANMPVAIQWVTVINPLRYFLVIIRGIFLKGVGLAVLWPELCAMALIGAIIFWQASLRFKKTLS